MTSKQIMNQLLQEVEACTTFEQLKAINDTMITRTDIYGTEKLTVMNALMRKRYSVN